MDQITKYEKIQSYRTIIQNYLKRASQVQFIAVQCSGVCLAECNSALVKTVTTCTTLVLHLWDPQKNVKNISVEKDQNI